MFANFHKIWQVAAAVNANSVC